MNHQKGATPLQVPLLLTNVLGLADNLNVDLRTWAGDLWGFSALWRLRNPRPRTEGCAREPRLLRRRPALNGIPRWYAWGQQEEEADTRDPSRRNFFVMEGFGLENDAGGVVGCYSQGVDEGGRVVTWLKTRDRGADRTKCHNFRSESMLKSSQVVVW